MALTLSGEVAGALQAGKPVVALETSIVAQGLPAPYNLRAALECERAIRDAGAVPATVAVLGGAVKVGLSAEEIEALASSGDALKLSSRDLGWAVAQRKTGATTVAATIRAADLAGIRFMATGGIGGVHRGHPDDVSADLFELARSRVAVFCAGAKIILDIPSTLERLESLAVPVLGYGCDEVPGFYVRRTGCKVGARVDSVEEAARVLKATWETGWRGVVIAVPPPEELADAERLVTEALGQAQGLQGKDVTPYLLSRISALSGGASVDVNVRLVVNNAGVAARCAVAWAAASA